MNVLNKHKRIVAFCLFLLFCLFSLFMIPVLEADAIVIPAVPEALIYILGTLLAMGGITFASTQDLNVGVNGFYNSTIYDTQMSAFTAALLAAPVVDGVLQLGEDLSTGWSYFWEHASDYFGVETGVKPNVNIDECEY